MVVGYRVMDTMDCLHPKAEELVRVSRFPLFCFRTLFRHVFALVLMELARKNRLISLRFDGIYTRHVSLRAVEP